MLLAVSQLIKSCLRNSVDTNHLFTEGFPRGHSGKESTCQCRRCKRRRFDPWVGKIPWSRQRLPTSVFLSGKFHGQRSLSGYHPWGRKQLDMIEQPSTAQFFTANLLFSPNTSVVQNASGK